MVNMKNDNEVSPYYIFMNAGDKIYLLGKNNSYETELSNAISFNEKIDAIEYVEKYGYQRIASVRRIKPKSNS